LNVWLEALAETLEKMDGKNQIKKFARVAGFLKSKIASFRGVAGIVFTGGLVRGFVDKYSDVDITVLLSEKNEVVRKNIRKIGKNEQRRSGVDVDLEVRFLEDFRTWRWDEMARWDFSHSEIVFDPEGNVRKLFNKKLRVPKSFWAKRIVVYGEYVKWYCCPPQDNVGTIAETWVNRGDLASAHYCLNYALSLLVRIVFALNKEFLPPPKWEIFYSCNLEWLPQDYKKLIGEALTVKSLSKPELDRRLRATRELWREILPKIREQAGLTPESISREYVKRVLRQG
jgi:predicted nucleotidyltransferase